MAAPKIPKCSQCGVSLSGARTVIERMWYCPKCTYAYDYPDKEIVEVKKERRSFKTPSTGRDAVPASITAQMSTVSEWPAYVFHKPDGLPTTLREAISKDAAERDLSLADTIRSVLCGYYSLDCPPRSKQGYQQDRDQGAVKLIVRMQPELFQAIKEDAQERGLTLRLVILGILLNHYEED